MTALLSLLGLGSVRTLALYALAFALAVAVATGAGYWSGRGDGRALEAAAWAAQLAVQKAEAARVKAASDAAVLAAERAAASLKSQWENRYVELQQQTAAAEAESARLSADLRVAGQRLRQSGAGRRSGGGDVVPATADAAGRCQRLQAALDRALDAVELLQTAGDQAVADGQRGVDVATLAATAATTAPP